MDAKGATETKPLAKRAALEYLEKHGKATAKELGIDMDSRAATASELLERCTAQGLVEREEAQRPREYFITGPGRERLEFFRSQDAPPVLPAKTSNPSSENPSASNPGPSRKDQPEHESVAVEAIKQEVTLQFQNLREDIRDFVEAFGLRVPRGEKSSDASSPVEKLKGQLERLAAKGKEELASEAVVKLYRAGHALADPDTDFWGEGPSKENVADLQRQVGKEAAGKIERLVNLEGELDSEWYTEVLRLRSELNLPVDVVGVENEAMSEKKK